MAIDRKRIEAAFAELSGAVASGDYSGFAGSVRLASHGQASPPMRPRLSPSV